MTTNTNIENLKETLKTEVNALNALYKEGTAIDELIAQRAKVDTLVESINTETVNARIDALLAMELKPMFIDFINNQTITRIKVTENKERTEFIIGDSVTKISFLQLEEKSENPLCKGVYFKLMVIFMHNLYKSTATEANFNTSFSLNDEYAQLVKKYDFGKTSMVELEKQLNAILEKLLPEGLEIKAIKADVKYLLRAIGNTNDSGKTIIIQEKTFVKYLFAALDHRMNKKAYEVESKMTAHKSK